MTEPKKTRAPVERVALTQAEIENLYDRLGNKPVHPTYNESKVHK